MILDQLQEDNELIRAWLYRGRESDAERVPPPYTPADPSGSPGSLCEHLAWAAHTPDTHRQFLCYPPCMNLLVVLRHKH